MAVPALVLPVSGPYLGTWNAHFMGTLNDDGFVLSGTFQGQEVNLSDAFGMTLVEGIWRGLNWRVRFRGLEFNRPGILASMQAFGSSGAPTSTFTPIHQAFGDRMSDYAQALVLTSYLGGLPTFPNTLTALNSIVAPQSTAEYLMTSKVREAPFEMVLIPYSAVVGSLSLYVSFTTT